MTIELIIGNFGALRNGDVIAMGGNNYLSASQLQVNFVHVLNDAQIFIVAIENDFVWSSILMNHLLHDCKRVVF